ncbi:homeobox protein vex1-like [Rhinophrynus dorsalis]
MEKRPYSVEWLSESSQRKPSPPSMDYVKCRFGHTGFQNNDCSFSMASKPEVPSSTLCSEKENYGIRSVKADRGSQGSAVDFHLAPQDLSTCRKALKDVPACIQSPIQDDDATTDTESIKSLGSTTEDDTTSRARTKFSTVQLKELEKTFKEHRYIGASEKSRLSKVLKLSETQIKTWFQNRRMKFKRQSQDARVEAFISGLYLPYYGYSEIQGSGCSAQPEFTVPVPPPVAVATAAIPFVPLQSAVVRPGLQAAPSNPVPNFGSYPCSSMLVHPMINESIRKRFNPY